MILLPVAMVTIVIRIMSNNTTELFVKSTHVMWPFMTVLNLIGDRKLTQKTMKIIKTTDAQWDFTSSMFPSLVMPCMYLKFSTRWLHAFRCLCLCTLFLIRKPYRLWGTEVWFQKPFYDNRILENSSASLMSCISWHTKKIAIVIKDDLS